MEELQELKERLQQLETTVERLRIAQADSIMVTGGFISSASVANNGYYPAMVRGKSAKVTTTA